MKRVTIVAVSVALAGCSNVVGGGNDEPVTAERIETALGNIGVRPAMAGCIAPRILDQLDAEQVRAIEKLAEESSAVPGSLPDGKAMLALRRLEDRDVAKTVVSIAGGCGVGMMTQGI